VSVTMLGILVLQWIRQSEREARRIDRALDRAEALEAAEALEREKPGLLPAAGPPDRAENPGP